MDWTSIWNALLPPSDRGTHGIVPIVRLEIIGNIIIVGDIDIFKYVIDDVFILKSPVTLVPVDVVVFSLNPKTRAAFSLDDSPS